MALNNMKSELVKAGVKQYEAAEFLGMSANNFNRKLAETVPFTRDEMFSLRDRFFPGRTVDYLFASDGDVPSERERAKSRVQAIADNIANDGTPMDTEKAEIISDLMGSAERCNPAFVNHILNA